MTTEEFEREVDASSILLPARKTTDSDTKFLPSPLIRVHSLKWGDNNLTKL